MGSGTLWGYLVGGGCHARQSAIRTDSKVIVRSVSTEIRVGTKKTGKGRRKLGRKKRRMRSKIRHRKG
jgi:hypothetical protein